jgi:hypothetical protein
MNALRVAMRLRWVIALAALVIAWYVFKPVAYVLSATLCCAAPFDLAMALLPGSRRRADRAKREQVKRESRRLIDQA